MLMGLRFFVYLNELVMPTMQESRQIESSQSFELLWEKPIYSMPVPIDDGESGYGQVFLLVEGNQIIIPTSHFGNALSNKARLTSFDLETGQTNWQNSFNVRLDNIGNNSENIYIIGSNYTPSPSQDILNKCDPDLPVCESITIQAIDIASGEDISTIAYANMLHVIRFTVDDEAINIKGEGSHGSYYSEFSIDINNREKLGEFKGVTEFDDNLYENIAANLGFDRISSNYADNGTHIFFITLNGNRLWAIDKESMTVAGYVQFSGIPFDSLLNGTLRGFTVESDGSNMVVVYLGDSGQLFTFNFSPVH